ncbi:MAG: 16S rRNA (cytosine(967)-C(5))-methyltransferase RsmB [Vicinamibacteria bacterium]
MGVARLPVSSARSAAFEVLRRVEDRRGEPASLLADPRYRSLSSADRDLAMEIVFGVLRWRASLDWVLAHHASRPLADLDTTVLLALRMGLYQIRHLDRVPDRAAVDESVRLAGAYGASRGKGLVNAVLRSVLRQPGVPPFPKKEEDPVDYLASALSHPRWLAERYVRRLGLERAEARCQAQDRTPPVHVRVSARVGVERAREALAGEGVETEIVSGPPRCLRVLSGALSESSLLRRGLVFTQDAGSQLVPLLLQVQRSDRVLDVCAAPGGKATAMSELASEGSVIAIDRRRRRVRLLREIAERLQAKNVHPVVADGRSLPFEAKFARILLDVPCSSLGTLRRNPDVKWRVEVSDLERLAGLQLELLRSSSRLLTEDGRLVYATCSTEPEENEQVVERFLSESPGFRRVEPAPSLPEPARHLVDADGFFRTSPEQDDMDGYFAAILVRR